MILYNVVEKAFYQRLTHGLAMRNFCNTNNIQHHEYKFENLTLDIIEKNTSKDCIFCIDAAFLKIYNISVFDIRNKIPNGKIVVFGSDTLYFLQEQLRDEINGVEQVDLFLDTMQGTVDIYTKRNIKSDIWIWSLSEEYANKVLTNIDISKKTYDLFALMSTHYHKRQDIINNLNGKLKFLFAGGNIGGGIQGNSENLDDELRQAYSSAWCTFGTTSPSWTGTTRTMKGFKDLIAPFFGSLLIYDNHPNILQHYFNSDVVPIYDYDNMDSVVTTVDTIKSNKNYIDMVEKQREVFINMSLEKQYLRLFRKHNIL